MTVSETDLRWLARAVEMAEVGLAAGDLPFGTVVVSDGVEVFADHNRVGGGDDTRHPEFEAARWAVEHLSVEERAAATVYTSGEHCAMCAAAHGWVGLGRIVYAHSAAQLTEWFVEWGLEPAPVAPLPITRVVPGAVVDGPAPEFAERMKSLHARARGVE